MLNFLRREKLYILMLVFILAVNLLKTGHVEEGRQGEKKTFSNMTFEEIGITEGKVKDFFESEKISARVFKYSIIFGLFIFILAIALNLGYIFSGKRVNLETAPDKRPVSWGISDLIRASTVIIFTGYIIGIIEALWFRLLHFEPGSNLRMILDTFLIDIVVAIVILYFVIAKHRERFQSLGLKLSSFFRNVLSGITAYIFILPLLLVVLLLSIWVLSLLGYSPPPQPVFEVFMEEKRTRVLLFFTIFVSILGPIIEEIFFRGFMYSAIKKRLGAWSAAFLSASIFSFLHTNIVGFLPIMTLGVLLAYLYETTGSLIASMTVHIIHNSIIVSFVFFIKELIK